MKLKDFKIGQYFYTASGKWICADIGTKSIVGVKVVDGYPTKRFNWDSETGETTDLPDGWQTWEEIAKDPLVNGHCEVFHTYDMDGCSLNEKAWKVKPK